MTDTGTTAPDPGPAPSTDPTTTTDPGTPAGASDATIADLADTIAGTDTPTGPDNRPTDGAVLRYGKITAVGTGANAGKAQTDTTGSYWNAVDNSYLPQVGDLVYLFQQGPISHIGGRLGGAPSGPPVGVIHPFAGATAPTGWLVCDGAAVSRTTYAQLFAVCGTTYGSGDGSTTFNLPNTVDRVLVGSGTKFIRGEVGGSETFTLTTSQMPAHTHGSGGGHSHTGLSHDHAGSSMPAHDHPGSSHSHSLSNAGGTITVANTSGTTSVATGAAGTTGSTTVNVAAASAGTPNIAAASAGTNSTDPGPTASAGSGSSVNNMPPYISIGVCIIRALP